MYRHQVLSHELLRLSLKTGWMKMHRSNSEVDASTVVKGFPTYLRFQEWWHLSYMAYDIQMRNQTNLILKIQNNYKILSNKQLHYYQITLFLSGENVRSSRSPPSGHWKAQWQKPYSPEPWRNSLLGVPMPASKQQIQTQCMEKSIQRCSRATNDKYLQCRSFGTNKPLSSFNKSLFISH